MEEIWLSKHQQVRKLVGTVNAMGTELDRWFLQKPTNEKKLARLFVDVLRRVLEPNTSHTKATTSSKRRSTKKAGNRRTK